MTGSENCILTKKGPPTERLPALSVGAGGIESVNIEIPAKERDADKRSKQQIKNFLKGIEVTINYTFEVKKRENFDLNWV